MSSKVKAARVMALGLLLGSAALPGQQTPAAQQFPAVQPATTAPGCLGCELPVVLRQSVTAGKTKVGTKVQAKLVVATLLKGGVIPRDALISGEVVDSVAKSDSEPSRLAIRMDSAEWKNGSAKFKIYLTAWYYPPASMAAQDLSYRPIDAQNTSKNPGGTDYTEPKNPMSQQRFPRRDSDDSVQAAPPASSISKQRVLMKNIESTRSGDGPVVLVSAKSTIKLDKVTTYVLANGELLPGK
jgi:hypothetical protein